MACCRGRSGEITESSEGMISSVFRSDRLIASYRRELATARWVGRIIGMLHSLCSILAFCDLTWATVVLLGAFAGQLESVDFYSVFALLLLEATRLASAAFFTQLLTRFPNPGHPQYVRSHNCGLSTSFFRLLSTLLQALLIAPSFVWPIIRSSRIHVPSSMTRNLQSSLLIFYIVVIVSAALSTIISFLSFISWIYFDQLSEKSVLMYYDEVLHNTLSRGVVKADDFNFFHFAFRLLGRDYASYKLWEQIVKEHKKLLRYLYAHKQGADYLLACLDSEDAAVQQAAANTVGAWADGDDLPDKLWLPTELLTKLADMVGTGEVGWAAVNSFGALARHIPETIIKTITSSKQPVLDQIAELVDRSDSRSLASIRTLIFFYDAWLRKRGSDEPTPEVPNSSWKLSGDVEENLVQELKALLKQSSIQRLRVHAAYLLDLLEQLDAACWDHIKGINPQTDTHWYQVEKQMLEHLLTKISHPLLDISQYPKDYRLSIENLCPSGGLNVLYEKGVINIQTVPHAII